MIQFDTDDQGALADPLKTLSAMLAEKHPEQRKEIKFVAWVDDEDRDEMEAVWELIEQGFNTTVQRVSEKWGPPDFNGSYQEIGYPEDFWCYSTSLAYWLRGERVAYVVSDCADREGPLLLSYGTLAKEDLHPRQQEWDFRTE